MSHTVHDSGSATCASADGAPGDADEGTPWARLEFLVGDDGGLVGPPEHQAGGGQVEHRMEGAVDRDQHRAGFATHHDGGIADLVLRAEQGECGAARESDTGEDGTHRQRA